MMGLTSLLLISYLAITIWHNEVGSYPSVGSASFDSCYESIEIRFNDRISPQPNLIRNCNYFFDNTTLQLLGLLRYCVFRSTENSILVYPSPDGSITDAMNITFRAETLSSQGQSDAASTVITGPSAPSTGSSSSSVINICSCKDKLINIDAAVLPYHGYKYPTYVDWFVISQSPRMAANVSNFSTLVEANTTPLLEVPNNLVPSNFSANLAVRSRSTYTEAELAPFNVLVAEGCKPVLSLLGPNQVSASEVFVFDANVAFSECWHNITTVNFVWYLQDSNDRSRVELGQAKLTGHYLVINAGLLRVNKTYFVNVNVSVVRTDGLITELSTRKALLVKSLDPLVVLRGGDRDIGSNNLLILNAAWSFDPDLEEAEALYQWRCQDQSGLQCFNQSDNTSLVIRGDAGIAKLKMSEGSFRIGHWYTFSVSMAVGKSRFGMAQVKVRVLNGTLPRVEVDSNKHQYTQLETIVIRGRVTGWATTLRRYRWGCYDSSDPGLNDFLAMTLSPLTPTEGILDLRSDLGLESVRLVDLAVSTALFPPGALVRCQLTVESHQSVVASTLIQILKPVSFLKLEVSPPDGVEMETWFTIRVSEMVGLCKRWPVTFRFGYYAQSSSKLYFGGSSSRNSIKVLLPKPESGSLTVFAEVHGSSGDAVEINNKVNLNSSSSERSSEQVIAALSQNLQSKDVHASTYYMVLLARFLEDKSVALEAEALFNTYLSLVFLHDVVLRERNDIATAVGTFIKSTTQEFPPETMAEIKKFYNALYSSNTPMVGASYQNFSGEVTIFFDSMDELLLTKTFYNLFLTTIEETAKFFGTNLCPTLLQGQEISAGRRLAGVHIVRENFLAESAESLLEITENLKEKYRAWNCDFTEPLGCSGICLVTSYTSKEFHIGDDPSESLVSDVFTISLRDPVNSDLLPANETPGFYSLLIPVTQTPTIPSCRVADHEGHFIASMCSESTFTQIQSLKYVRCRCETLGKVAVFSVKPTEPPLTIPPVTTGPSKSFNVTLNAECDLYIGTKSEEDFRLSAQTSLARRLGISLSRVHVTGLACGSIVVQFVIDDTTPSTSEPMISDLSAIFNDILVNNTFEILLSSGEVVNQFFPSTTSKPPTTFPPVGELSTNWTALICGILVVGLIVLACVILTVVQHKLYLKKKIFTPYNSDKKKSKEVDAKTPRLNRGEKWKKLNKIMEADLDQGKDEDLLHSSISMTQVKKRRNQIVPVSDVTGVYLSEIPPYYFNESAMLDAPRLALDTSSDESDFEKDHNEQHRDSPATVSSETRASQMSQGHALDRPVTSLANGEPEKPREDTHSDSGQNGRPRSVEQAIHETEYKKNADDDEDKDEKYDKFHASQESSGDPENEQHTSIV